MWIVKFLNLTETIRIWTLSARSLSVCGPAFWDATRAFMLLAVLSCFAGIVLGLSAFTNGTKNKRVRTGGIALVLSGNQELSQK